MRANWFIIVLTGVLPQIIRGAEPTSMICVEASEESRRLHMRQVAQKEITTSGCQRAVFDAERCEPSPSTKVISLLQLKSIYRDASLVFRRPKLECHAKPTRQCQSSSVQLVHFAGSTYSLSPFVNWRKGEASRIEDSNYAALVQSFISSTTMNDLEMDYVPSIHGDPVVRRIVRHICGLNQQIPLHYTP